MLLARFAADRANTSPASSIEPFCQGTARAAADRSNNPGDRSAGRSFANTGIATSSGILVAVTSAIRAAVRRASRWTGGSISSTSESIGEGLRGLFKQMRSLGHSFGC